MGYLVLGTVIVWLLIFGYTLSIGSRQKKVEKQLLKLMDGQEEGR
jgi:CcmD family protein